MDVLSHVSPLLKMEAYVNGFVPSTLYLANQKPLTGSSVTMNTQLDAKSEPLGSIRTSETGSPSRLSRVCSPDSTNLDFCKTITTTSSYVGSLPRCISSSSGYIPTSVPKLSTRDENNNTTTGSSFGSTAPKDSSASKHHPHFSADFRTLRQNLMLLRRSNQQNKILSSDCEDSQESLFTNVVPAHTKVNNYELADRFSSWLKVCMFQDVPDISPFPAYLLKNETSNCKDGMALDFSLSKHVPCFNSSWPVKEVNVNENFKVFRILILKFIIIISGSQ